MDLKRVFSKGEGVAWNAFEDGCVLLHVETGYYYTLNEVGKFVWESMDGSRSLEDIRDSVAAVYDASREEVGRDLAELAEQLACEGLATAE